MLLVYAMCIHREHIIQSGVGHRDGDRDVATGAIGLVTPEGCEFPISRFSRQLDRTNVATYRMLMRLGEYSMQVWPLGRGNLKIVQGYPQDAYLFVPL